MQYINNKNPAETANATYWQSFHTDCHSAKTECEKMTEKSKFLGLVKFF